jgi:hypothetical protein
LYNIVIEFGIPMNLVKLIKMLLNETYSRAQAGKYMCDMFPIRNGLKKGAVLSPFLYIGTIINSFHSSSNSSSLQT